jgi:hypothetical protein
MSRNGSAPPKTCETTSFLTLYCTTAGSREGGGGLRLAARHEPSLLPARPRPDTVQQRLASPVDSNSVKTIRPDKTEPIPLRAEPPQVGTIMIRFIVLLAIAVVVLALAWSR